MSAHLGLVCITHSDAIRYKTITRKRLLQHELSRQRTLLEELYRENLRRLDVAFRYCRQERIFLYRIPSGIFPFADDVIGREVLETLAEPLARIGTWASAHQLRLVMHPDQFVVLSSDSENVVRNSITILSMHAHIMDKLMQPRSPWALIEIHGGKSNRGSALVERIATLPEAIRLRLGLENDEYAYSAPEIHEICIASGVPMVFDAHHHIVHENLASYEDPSVGEMLRKARETWAIPEHQLVHISNGRDAFNDRKHADLIDVMPSSYSHAPWIEIEAKYKERAIGRLRENGVSLSS